MAGEIGGSKAGGKIQGGSKFGGKIRHGRKMAGTKWRENYGGRNMAGEEGRNKSRERETNLDQPGVACTPSAS